MSEAACNRRRRGVNRTGDSNPYRPGSPTVFEMIYNHDSCLYSAALLDTDMSEQTVIDHFVTPFAKAGITVIDWCIFSSGFHNCRTRYHHGITCEVQRMSHQQNPEAWGEKFEKYILKVAKVYDIKSERWCLVVVDNHFLNLVLILIRLQFCSDSSGFVGMQP